MQMAAVILGAPFAAFAVLGLVPALRRTGRPAAGLSILGIAASLAASIVLLVRYLGNPVPIEWEFVWAPLSTVPAIRFGILLDGLSVPMLAVVSLVAFVVQVYSLGYMSDESRPALGRYYAYHSLFATAMLGLVASHNTLQTYFFWELVGLGSYLLIGFWYTKPEANRAANKAFWTTRLGDVGFALGVIFLWSAGGSFVFSELFEAAATGSLSGTFLKLGVAGLFLGAMGKSAQFPLHIWLPDAMEGPTPVSALIHAATMVAAGVYLMVRITPLLAHAPEVSAVVVTLGVVTALLAATMALVARDIKRVLAFSTVSQLGYMMVAVGAAAATASFFHLTTHAFFKALLFLAAGSVIHAVHTNDIFSMGGLFKKMPATGALFLIGALALAGVWPLSGFFSKDEILIDVYVHGHTAAFWALLITAGLTAFYMFRVFFTVFFGRARSKAHESPAVMVLPMAILGVLAIVAGYFGPTIKSLLSHSISVPAHIAGDALFAGGGTGADAHGPAWIPAAGLVAAVLGIAIAWAGYARRMFDPAQVRAKAGPLVTLFERGYFVDDVFLFLYRALYIGLGKLIGWIDRYVIDGLVNFLSWLTYATAARLRNLHQTGRMQDSLYAIAVGFLILVLLAMRL